MGEMKNEQAHTLGVEATHIVNATAKQQQQKQQAKTHTHTPQTPPRPQLAPFQPRGGPTSPVYDAHEWVSAHYPRYGYAARGPLYSWRDWAAAALPPGDAEALFACEAVMADDDQRAGLLRQAQWVRVLIN
jgi:hypothetical protein